MAELLKGAPVAAALNEKLTGEVKRLAASGVIPTLAIVRVGERPDDVAYERGAIKRCETIGVVAKVITLPDDTSQDQLIMALYELNGDASVHGVLLFRPLPKWMDENAVRNALAPEKDVDGITDASLAGVFAGTDTGYAPCTPEACMEILDYYGIDATGRRAVVVGRSLVAGKPAAMMLIRRNATVTVCHTKTADMPAVCREAEILIVAAGRPKMIDGSYLSPGQIVVDVGINVDGRGNLCGDVDAEEAQGIVRALTPVPGGVGTVTTSVLAGHVVEAAKRNIKS